MYCIIVSHNARPRPIRGIIKSNQKQKYMYTTLRPRPI